MSDDALAAMKAKMHDAVVHGDLPSLLEGAAWKDYVGPTALPCHYAGWCRMWFNIAWVRYQAFEREAEAVDAAAEYL